MRSKEWAWPLLLFAIVPAAVRAADGPVLYRLGQGSTFLDDCLPCARPPLLFPLEGTFVLTLENIGDVTDWYKIDSIDFRTTPGQYVVSGSGRYLTRLGAGGVVDQQAMSLDVEINGEAGLKLESGEVKTTVGLPALDIEVVEVTSSLVRIFRLHLIAAPADSVPYELLPGSVFADDCLDCDRVLIPHPLTGGFLLSKVAENPLFTDFRLSRIDFRSAEVDLTVTGQGIYSFGGEVALVQEMDLDVSASAAGSARSLVLSSGGRTGMLGRRFPEIEIGLKEKDPPDPLHIYTVHLVARPRAQAQEPFRRGDPNDDGRLDVSDAVHVLFWLFAGGPQPGCLDAANADGNGRIDITDPIYLLDYLFLAGPAPPPPGPGACGQSGKPLPGCLKYTSCNGPPAL